MTPEIALARGLSAPLPGILDLLGQSGPMARCVLALLGLLSVVSWAIMVERWRRFRHAGRESRALLERLSIGPGFTGVLDLSRHLTHSPLAALYSAFMTEVARFQAKGILAPDGMPISGNPGHLDPRVRVSLVRALEKASLVQSRRFQRFLGFLATTATVAPFIGLFGTVWGIMNAFRSIGAAGGASLAAYAPGIAEALVTTAAGLAAAIPAVAGYNYFVARVRHVDEEMEDFAADLLTRVESLPR